ncbi:MAG: hypothetical protein ABSF25_20300 [Bryobacteraceae bacterium]
MTRIIAELRAERAGIERAIRSLERSDRVHGAAVLTVAHSTIETGSGRDHRVLSFRRWACRRQVSKLSV